MGFMELDWIKRKGKDKSEKKIFWLFEKEIIVLKA